MEELKKIQTQTQENDTCDVQLVDEVDNLTSVTSLHSTTSSEEDSGPKPTKSQMAMRHLRTIQEELIVNEV